MEKYILKYKSCHKTNGIALEPKRANILLGPFDNKNVTLVLSRISGNGKINIKLNNKENKEYCVLKKTQELLNFNNCNEIEITRPKDSIGQVSLNNIIINEDEVDLNWKNILSQIKYEGLRAVNNKLFVSNAAFIDISNVECIETNPSNIFYKKDNKYIFNSNGEIKNIKLKNIIIKEEKINFYNKLNFVDKSKNDVKNETATDKPIMAIKQINNCIFDTDNNNSFSSLFLLKNKFSKIVKSNGKNFLILKKFGIFSQSISNLNKNNTYTFVIHGKKINGNGKARFSLNNLDKIDINFDNNFHDKIFKFTISENDNKLTLSFDENGFGELLIARICIFDGEIINNLPSLERIVYAIKETPDYYENNIINFQDEEFDSVRFYSKKFAKHNIQKININKQLNLTKIISTNTFSCRQWFGKIKQYLPNTIIKDNYKLFENSRQDIEENISFVNINDLKNVSNNIFLEELNSKNISDENINILNNISNIITPSLIDFHLLKQKLKNTNIYLNYKPWPIIKVKPIPDNFFIYLEKDYVFTKYILSIWKEHYPKLVVVGSNVKPRKNIITISEYENYETLLSYIFGAKCVLDFSYNDNYHSGLLDLCLEFDKNIITNNLFYITDKNINICNIKNSKKIQNIIESMFTKNINYDIDFEKLEYNFINNLSTLLEMK